MKTLLISLFILTGSLLAAQDNTYYYGINGKIVEQEDNPIYQQKVWNTMTGYRQKVYLISKDGWKWIRTEKTGVKKNGQLNIRYRHETFFPRTKKRFVKEIGVNQYYFRDEKGIDTLRVGTASSLVPLHLESMVTEFYKGGALKSKSFYENNELRSNENWNEDGTEYISNIFYSADQMPLYLNGQKALLDYVLKTMSEKKFPIHEVEDEIMVGGVVMENGELSGLRILKGKVASVNQFFLDTFSEIPGKWQPATLDGHMVRCFIIIPINLIHNSPMLQNVEFTSGQLFWND